MFGTFARSVAGLFMASAALLTAVPSGAGERIYFLNSSIGAPFTTADRSGFQDLVVGEVFKRLGLRARVTHYAGAKRSFRNANAHIDDGVAMCAEGLELNFPNLIRVDEVILEREFVAYSRDLTFRTNNWGSLKPYDVAYVHGRVIFERNLASDQRKHAVRDPDQLFAMLAKGRVDVALYDRWLGSQRAIDTGVKVKAHEPPLARVKMYMYMHKDHIHLVRKMASALRDMKVDGTYRMIVERSLNIPRAKP